MKKAFDNDKLSEEKLRKNKLSALKKTHQDPFQKNNYLRDTSIQNFINKFSELEKEAKKKSIAGRILTIRDLGNIIFATISDQTGNLQIILQKVELQSLFDNFKEIDLGDIIGVEGIAYLSKSGEFSLKVNSFTLLSKCLKPIPSNYYGFENIEERFRKRYLDLMVNQEKRQILIQRFHIVNGLRNYLNQKEFIEVETPVLVAEASGAQAKPFITYHNKLQRNFYLRIATEIPLKKLLVGGLEKVYEIGRIFRNEGIDARHNPEFTTVEIYQAYENSEYMMKLTENLFHFLAKEVIKKEEIKFNSHLINLQEKFHKMSMFEAIKEQTNIDFRQINKLEEALELAKKHHLKLEKFQTSIGQVILAFFEEYVEKKLIQPTFIYDYPLETSPLAKSRMDNKDIADRFELFIGGLEFANGYSELNDAVEQKKRFEEQIKQKKLGNEEIASFDQDFIESLEYGMPPAGGLGIGIDRLVMLLTGQDSIKEVIAFPQLKSKI